LGILKIVFNIFSVVGKENQFLSPPLLCVLYNSLQNIKYTNLEKDGSFFHQQDIEVEMSIAL